MITREYPQSKNEFLRFQVGTIVTRPEQIPIYPEDSKRISHFIAGEPIEIFKILGFGSTEAKAKKMANI
jgi:hypothetical protein